MDDWKPISQAPIRNGPIIVWLPLLQVMVSAAPFNLQYAEDGNTVVGWDGDPVWSMTDCNGDPYMLPLAEAPSHWLDVEAPQG